LLITAIKRKPLAIVILISIFVLGVVNSSSLVYAYLTITSPTRDQQIPAGGVFHINGTSKAANGTNHCVVSVIINAIRPYQKVIPLGTNGTQDYTSWQFVSDPNYATVKLGENKITAKYSCFPNSEINNKLPNYIKYHSLNITGIGQPQQPQQTSSLSSSPPSPPSPLAASTKNIGGNIVNEPKHSKIIK
jgi:hypothetical protein